MPKDQFTPGDQVVHKKMQVIGVVVKSEGDLVHVKIAPTIPVQVWKIGELVIWDAKEEIQKKLKQGGYIRNVFRKLNI